MAEEAVSIKGTKNGLVILFNPDTDIEEAKNTLRAKMETSRDFFRGARFSVCSSVSNNNPHFANELEGICIQYGLVPSGEVHWPSASNNNEKQERAAQRKRTSQVVPIRKLSPEEGEQILLVKRTIRSGQRISSPHSIMVLGDVNPGAELISGGSVYVMGNCKGSIHAGSAGNIMTEVVALNLQPAVLRIGTIMADTSTPAAISGPGTARVYNNKIIFSSY
ncbi:MAG: septum site-determining protein MinC [Bacillota bacterium]